MSLVLKLIKNIWLYYKKLEWGNFIYAKMDDIGKWEDV